MCRERSAKKQMGAGLPIALFIITALSLIVLGMSQLQESSGKSISLQIQSQRAFFAAESGVQLGVGSIFPDNSGQPMSCTGALTGSVGFSVSGLSGCTATISCVKTGDLVIVTAEGQCGAGAEQANRTVQVRLR